MLPKASELFPELFQGSSRLLELHPGTQNIFWKGPQGLVEVNFPKALEYCPRHQNPFEEMFQDLSKFQRPLKHHLRIQIIFWEGS